MQCDGGMCVGRWIDDQRIGVPAGVLNEIDQFAFDIGLPEHDRHIMRRLPTPGFDVSQCFMPIDFGFACAEKVQVGPVDYVNGYWHSVLCARRGRVLTRASLSNKHDGIKRIPMHLIINGVDHDALPDGLTVAGLIAHLGLPKRKIAIERNLEVVPKSRFGELVLANGDRLEIIHFIGGG